MSAALVASRLVSAVRIVRSRYIWLQDNDRGFILGHYGSWVIWTACASTVDQLQSDKEGVVNDLVVINNAMPAKRGPLIE